jgi:hypothetical protein
LVFAGTNLRFKIEDNSLELLASKDFGLSLSQESKPVLIASVETSLSVSIVGRKSCALILKKGKLSLSSFKSL